MTEMKNQQSALSTFWICGRCWGLEKLSEDQSAQGVPFPSTVRQTNVNRAVIEDPSSLLPERKPSVHLGWDNSGHNQAESGKPMRNNQREGSKNLYQADFQLL